MGILNLLFGCAENLTSLVAFGQLFESYPCSNEKLEVGLDPFLQKGVDFFFNN